MTRRINLMDMIDLLAEWDTYHAEHPDATIPELAYIDDDENTVTVIDTEMFWDYLVEKFPSFYFDDPQAYFCIKTDAPYQVETGFINFVREWELYLNAHPEYSRIAQMMDRTDYDPLENYDRKEDGGWKDTTDDDAVHKMQYAQVETTTTNDPKIKTKTSGFVFADDSSAASPDTESVTEPVRANASDVDTIKTTTPLHTDESSVTGDVVVTRLFQNYRIHGNVGVTTAAQMMEGEIKVREKYNLITRVLDGFAKKVLTLRKEVVKYDS